MFCSPLMHRSMNFHRENRENPGKNCKVLARNKAGLVLPFSEADPHVSEVQGPTAGRGLGSLQRVSAAAQANAYPEQFFQASCQADIRQECTTVNELKHMKLPLF